MPKAKTKARVKPRAQRGVWIELEAAANPADAEENCRLANRMLSKLGGAGDQRFFWLPRGRDENGPGDYCYGGPGGYVTLSDRGHWFNLVALGG